MPVVVEARFLFLHGTLTTVQITVLALLLAGVLSFGFGLLAVTRHPILRVIATVYVELFRGVALLVQLFWLFFVLPFFGIVLSPLATAVLGLGLCNGAYGAEIVRGAINAVPSQQWEAARSLNYPWVTAMVRIILPQAVPAMLPPFCNLSIELLKATALVSLITIQDLSFQAHMLRQTTMQTAEVFTAVLVIYFCLAQGINLGFRGLERVMGRGLDRGGR